MMGRRHFRRPHLQNFHSQTAARSLPGRFGAGQPAPTICRSIFDPPLPLFLLSAGALKSHSLLEQRFAFSCGRNVSTKTHSGHFSGSGLSHTETGTRENRCTRKTAVLFYCAAQPASYRTEGSYTRFLDNIFGIFTLRVTRAGEKTPEAAVFINQLRPHWGQVSSLTSAVSSMRLNLLLRHRQPLFKGAVKAVQTWFRSSFPSAIHRAAISIFAVKPTSIISGKYCFSSSTTT
jgi:hypothetical protein